MTLRSFGLATTAFVLGALATACSKGPDLDRIRQDFDHPTGSVASKEGLIAATSQREASGPALALAGGGVPGQALTASASALDALAPMRLHGRQLSQLRARLQGRAIAALEAFPGDEGYANTCEDAPEAQAAYERAAQQLLAGGGSSASASASYSIDVASCSGGRMTGKLDVELELRVESKGADQGSFTFHVAETFHDVCEVGGEARCVDGDFVVEASMAASSAEEGRMEMIAGWELDSAWTHDGVRREASTKGGVRTTIASSTGGAGTFQVEYLVYVTNADGDEVSYVLSVSADAEGAATLAYRGADGTVECAVSADGAGRCTATGASGTETITWTAEEYAAR